MGECLCGCGEETSPRASFRPGHNLKLAKAAAAAAKAEAKGETFRVREAQTELGVHGTPIWAGLIYEDFNAKFTDLRTAVATYDEMRRTDGTVQALLLALELPIVQAEWFIKPASQEKRDLAIAELVRWNLFEGMTISFQDFLRQALSMHWAGFAAFEKVFEEKAYKRVHFIGWRKFAQRLANTVARWEFDEHGGPKALWQQPPDRPQVRIPIWKLLLFSNRKEGGNVQGMSFLRAGYKHWYMKDRLYRLQAIGLERDVTGIPVMSLPPSASAEDRKTAKRIVTSLRRDEEGGVVKSQNWELSLLPAPGATTGRENAFTDAIRHHDLALAKSVLAQVLNLGEGPKGSFALGAVMSDLLTMAEEAQADYISDCISDHAIRQFVQINFPGASYPRLEHGEIRKRDIRQVAIVLTSMANAGLIQIDPALLAYIRRFLGLPQTVEVPRGAAPPAQLEGARLALEALQSVASLPAAETAEVNEDVIFPFQTVGSTLPAKEETLVSP